MKHPSFEIIPEYVYCVKSIIINGLHFYFINEILNKISKNISLIKFKIIYL